ncbi:MAG: MFS transporter [Deltaproteobacteria bacterium]|nr:MFS transporter [Deltaproteobacteria bacterium]MBW2052637.1 MFS transporter [Deltaproteobacteria bacterium]MBW2323054.1 MFS transporter [Deltaproteobacteria bacterium]
MSEHGRQKKKPFYGIWIVAGCFVLLFLYAGAGFYSFSIFIKPLEDYFGWSRAQISFTMSIYMIIHGIIGPFVGHITGIYGPRKVMTLFALGSGASFILVSFTNSLWSFYLAYACLSFTTVGIGFIPVSSLLARWFVRRRGTAIGSAMVGIAAGGLVVAPLMGQIVSHFSWRMSFVFLGLLTWLLSLPITLLVLKSSPADMDLLPDGDTPEPADNQESMAAANSSLKAQEEGWPLSAALRSRSFYWIAAAFFFAPLAQLGILQHQVPLIIEAGISQAAAATALGLTAGFGGLGKLSFGRITELLPFRYAASLCFGLQALSVLILFNAHNIFLVWVYVAVFGFAMGGLIVLLPLAVGHFFGLAAFGVLMGAITMVQSFGSSAGAFLSGLIYDYMGSYHYALVAYICIYLAAIVAIFLAGEPKPYARD